MFHVKHCMNKQELDILYKLAYKSFKNNEVPVGSIVIYNGKIIGKGCNDRQKQNYVCGHAEINAINEAEHYMNDWRLNDCILISTLMPCEMCKSVIKESRISKVYYIIDQSNHEQEIPENYEYSDVSDDYYNKLLDLLNQFFKNLR